MNSVKNLYIVRHGKSTWDNGDFPDIDRPLKERGVGDAYTMAKKMLLANKLPEKIISSPAARALHTAAVFARSFGLPYHKLIIHEDIYMADLNLLLNIIKQTENHILSLMIFGHNPTFTDLANYFLGDTIENIPTTGVVGLKFELESWSDISQTKPIESFFDFPKNIINK